jgi:hypothetical protein
MKWMVKIKIYIQHTPTISNNWMVNIHIYIYYIIYIQHMAVCQNLVPLVNIKIAGKWMLIPLKMVLISIDPYPYIYINIYIPIQHISTYAKVCGPPGLFFFDPCHQAAAVPLSAAAVLALDFTAATPVGTQRSEGINS